MNIDTVFLSEDAVDRHIARVIRFDKGSDTYVKCACIAAAPIVGTYSDATAQIAKARNRSVSTVQNWAHGFWMYRELRSNGHRKQARLMWRELPASHFWLAWDIHTAGYDAFGYLYKAHQHHWSGREMIGNYKAERDEGTAPLQRTRQILALRGLAGELIEHPQGLNTRQINAARELLAAFELKNV